MKVARRLILFDVDGTLVDSQGSIVAAMGAAFAQTGLAVPERASILSIVGLSLEHAMYRLAPDASAPVQAALAAAYRQAYFAQRVTPGDAGSPLYPGAREALCELAGDPHTLLGVATGKSRRGLDAVLEQHGLDGMFVTLQTADIHPSKPHPSMLAAAMAQTGVCAADTVMIGDTSYDMEMARAAGVSAIGVGWGYHPRGQLHLAHCVIDSFVDLPRVLGAIRKATA